jgi:hypothetical protein
VTRVFLSGAPAAAILLVGLVGCGDGSSGQPPPNNCPVFQDPAGTDLTKPVTTLKTDVVPIFQSSCSLSTACHGAPGGGPGHLFLGQMGGPVDTAMLAQTLQGHTVEEPAQVYVKPGDPTASYLMNKMDGDQCLYDPDCTMDPTLGTNCADAGATMPYTSGALPVATRDTVRRWIAQGAQNN